MKITAVIVTYNRLKFLQKCLQAVREQTRKPDTIIVVNNGSTDGTQQWLTEQPVITYNQANLGGAGGFSSGIDMAYSLGTDWIWLMDDDTIPHPDALQQLLTAFAKLEPHQSEVGFLCSVALWTDGSIHKMNRPRLQNDIRKAARFSFVSENNYPLVQFGTFVSMLLSSKAVEKVGLPIKEYFIWCDDVEYTKRIINSGMAGLAVKESLTLHETPTNHESNVFLDSESSIWKFKYGLRNELYTKRLHEGELNFWISWIHRMLIMPFRIAIRRKNHRWPFIKLIWNTSLKALFFRPAIVKAGSFNLIHTTKEKGTAVDLQKQNHISS
jgi:GT2 family glycosyltransferase